MCPKDDPQDPYGASKAQVLSMYSSKLLGQPPSEVALIVAPVWL
jgi:hypothetical protein